jgi:transposase InsO family protein
VGTYSGVLLASAHTGETTKHALGHLLGAFATFGIPKPIKMDNGSAYTSKKFQKFYKFYGTLLTILGFLTILKAKPL